LIVEFMQPNIDFLLIAISSQRVVYSMFHLTIL
jgi:hypothetical protein